MHMEEYRYNVNPDDLNYIAKVAVYEVSIFQMLQYGVNVDSIHFYVYSLLEFFEARSNKWWLPAS